MGIFGYHPENLQAMTQSLTQVQHTGGDLLIHTVCTDELMFVHFLKLVEAFWPVNMLLKIKKTKNPTSSYLLLLKENK